MPQLSTSTIGDNGVRGVGLLVGTRLGWIFRNQPEHDVGIDGQIETDPDHSGGGSGKMIAVQIKAGVTVFSEQSPDGAAWVFRENAQTHRDYWLNYRLPVVLVLYDEHQHVAYWQHVTSQTAVITGSGFKILVPKDQRIDANSAEQLAAIAAQPPENGLQELLDQLPLSCAARLSHLESKIPTLARRLARELVDGRFTAERTVEGYLRGAKDDTPVEVWAALGDYAAEYGTPMHAAECYLRADAVAVETQRGRWAGYAGCLLAPSDPRRAETILTRAHSEPAGRLLAALGLAWLAHGQRPGPVPVPNELRGACQVK